jgi:hypothetical protein
MTWYPKVYTVLGVTVTIPFRSSRDKSTDSSLVDHHISTEHYVNHHTRVDHDLYHTHAHDHDLHHAYAHHHAHHHVQTNHDLHHDRTHSVVLV